MDNPKTESNVLLNEENIVESELFKELTSAINNGAELPYIEKGKVLMAPGVWNGCHYSREEIINAYKNTDWEDRYNSNLLLDHQDQRFSEWVGSVENKKIDENTGYIYGDLYIYDPITAIKFKYGKPKTGISPKVTGQVEDKSMKKFTFNNFSIVINPAVKKAFINNSDGSRPVFFSEGGVAMSDLENKPVEGSDAVAEKDAPAKLSEIEEFTKFYEDFVKTNAEAKLADVFKAFADSKGAAEEPAKPEEDEKKKKKEDEVPDEGEKPEEAMSENKKEIEGLKEQVKTMSSVIAELSKQVKTLEAPEKMTSKVSGVVAEMASSQDSDEQFLGFLKRM